MIPAHLAKLEAALRNSANIPEDVRKELLELVVGLRAEVSSGEHPADGQPATTQTIDALSASVQKLEGTHPQLVEMVNQLALTLSNLGI
jgi:hypothetical protein